MSEAEALRQGLLNLVERQAFTSRDLLLGPGYPLLRRGVCQQLKRCLDGLEILGRDQDNIFAAIPRDVDTLVRAVHFLGDLGQPCLDVRQRQHNHRLRL